ncbi:WD repeat-containing protein 43 [Trichonephila clavata]|uniref:WD repeat-containing protein 43 n=1 Tax=Trichonephila clavata TaxID=2740835 RepID=A0A8X6M4I0_TRICU|nr:WD repeat-containing protein 43 [Trichonephila clavata]
MLSRKNILAFSHRGEYLAYSLPDGRLKIWETSTGVLKQEFIPSSHLSATCKSLSWGPTKRNSLLPKRPKKSSNETLSIEDLQLIAMGTILGDILLYSFSKADLHSCLKNGHTNSVNDICWSVATNSLFTCSEDQHIIQWEISSGKIKSKWKADNFAIYCLCVINDRHIISAGNTVQLWDIQQKSVIKNFPGHLTEISQILSPQTNNEAFNEYFITSALGDRVINVWQIEENNTKGAIASFISFGEPKNIDTAFKKDEPLRMSVVTEDGLFHLFEHTLNEKLKKPLSPKITIQIASKGNSNSKKPYPLPIIAANISEGLDFCLIVYGSFLTPVFERINISDVSKDLILTRDLSLSSAVSIEGSVTRIKKPDKPNNVSILAPGYMTDVSHIESVAKKRKKREIDSNMLPIEEHLKALDLGQTPKTVKEEPSIKSDSMVHLLLLALQSKDNNLLNTVFECVDKIVIHNTLQRLPLQSILLVLKELYERLNKQESRNHPCLRWLIELLTVHLPYLMSCKDIGDILGPICQLIDARVENFPKMRLLQAGLKVLLSQAESNFSNLTEDPSVEPLIEYESESSNDSDIDDVNISEDHSEEQVTDEDDSLCDESESSNFESDIETQNF